MIDEGLIEFASPRQAEFVRTVNEIGSVRGAARELGIHHKTVQKSLDRLKLSAANRGYSPAHKWTHTVPEGFGIKRMSTNFDREGNVAQQWVISNPDQQQQLKMMQAAIEAMCGEIKPLAPTIPPVLGNENLLNLYTITDYHMGLACSKLEGLPADWDLNIAEDTLVSLFENLISRSPNAHTAVLNQLGDFLHFDSLLAVTPTSHHVLDAASRYELLVQVVIRAMRRVVSMLLQEYQHVHIIMAEGNHDLASSVWLRQMFAVLYENEPRVTVDTSHVPFYCYEWGKTFLGFHHGHRKKKESLPLLFAAMFRESFGRTTAGWIHTGHEHHVDEKEYPGFKVIQHPTIAAPDNYAVSHGWMSQREASVITYHKNGYQVSRTTMTPEMLDAAVC